jgi:hypothetical protein
MHVHFGAFFRPIATCRCQSTLCILILLQACLFPMSFLRTCVRFLTLSPNAACLRYHWWCMCPSRSRKIRIRSIPTMIRRGSPSVDQGPLAILCIWRRSLSLAPELEALPTSQ